ncbi:MULTISPECIES: peptidoglycan DD-metalloendopeptidase family protein [unclassified Pseudomonas]|uniref:peptidoglycan DD-metalloendopeptidase family protein n=1 Tax=unclassified Pseudomonas TaxID=196821 RepID=UPI0013DD972B|nr:MULTISPECIES: peptidoglycan DD-metalloendopeptidase family protein [unclassified Pseudomonas]
MFLRLILFALLLTLSSCSSPFPVFHSTSTNRDALGEYKVKRGDTLWSIAAHNGLKWKNLARSNRLASPYTLKVDQLLRLEGARTQPRGARKRKVASISKFGTVSLQPPPTKETLQGWSWPIHGVLIGRFSPGSKLTQGIRIAAVQGQPIYASLGGKVMFAGYMRGYGNVLILQHSPSYTSTYTYNSRLVVKEDQMVIKGQKIAEAGAQDTNRAQLYFEIRVNGVPVDPQQLLPPV